MLKKSILIVMIMAFAFISCDKTQETVDAKSSATPNTIIKDANGNELEMSYDVNTEITTLYLPDGNQELKKQKTASGFRYSNEHYDLSGKGNDITLEKDGVIIFEHKDDIEKVEAKAENGSVLNLTLNHTSGNAKAYLNGGEEINMTMIQSENGVSYKNDEYELINKNGHYTLTKSGTILFEN